MRVLLVVPPFGLIEYPNLATSLLKAEVVAAGFECDLRYASVEFARRIGYAPYVRIYSIDAQLLIPERLFASLLFGDRIPAWARFWREVVAPYDRPLNTRIRSAGEITEISQLLEPLEKLARDFVEEFAQQPGLEDYDLIGFSTSYGQNCAALAMAQRIKQRLPGTPIILGGANCAGGMGEKMLDLFPFIDYVCVEDGDVAFPRFVGELAEGKVPAVAGIVSRAHRSVANPARATFEMVTDLDALPYPDFSDFFAAFDFGEQYAAHVVAIPMETSRGCWWGQKHHCTFCGLNRDGMAYRRKSPERIDAEMRHLIERFGLKRVMMTDNIMSRSFVKDTLPLLAREPAHDHLFFEAKSNLTREELRALKAARVGHLQPGIESLSTHVLQLMDKGVDSLQNIQTLKWGKELGVGISWNVLCGFPGETPEDYDEMARLIPKIHHLEPALGFAQITIDRFSPLFLRSKDFGITTQPVRAYRYIYPFAEADMRELAYWFSQEREGFDGRVSLAVPPYAKSAFQAYTIWRRLSGRCFFDYVYSAPDRILVRDTRGVSQQEERALSPLETRVFEALDARASFPGLMKRLSEGPDTAPSELEVQEIVDSFRAANWLAEDGGRMLMLAHLRTGSEPKERENSLRATIELMRGMRA